MHWILAKDDELVFGIFAAIILGLIFIVALAQLIVGMVEQRSRHNATMLRPDSQPPAR